MARSKSLALCGKSFELSGNIGRKIQRSTLIVQRPTSKGLHVDLNEALDEILSRRQTEKSCNSDGCPYIPRFFMAKTSWINRNERKRATVKKYAAVRAELKAKKDYAGLAQLPRDASPTRVVNRCEVTGRRRAFIRRFKISRLTFRELASQGLIPGVTKSSW